MKAKTLVLGLLIGSLNLSATNLDTKDEIDDFSISLSSSKISTIEPKMKIGLWYACAIEQYEFSRMDPYQKAEAAQAALDTYMLKTKTLPHASRIGEEVTITTEHGFDAYDLLIGGHKIQDFSTNYSFTKKTGTLSVLTYSFDGIKNGVDNVLLVSAAESKQIFTDQRPSNGDSIEDFRRKLDRLKNPVMASIKVKGIITEIKEKHFEDVKSNDCRSLDTKIKIKIKHIDVYNSLTNELLYSKNM